MNKKGQFYLIAALIVISLVAGATAVYNLATAPEKETLFYNLQEEASYEAGQIINHGLYNSLEPNEISNNIGTLATYYYSSNPDVDILTIEGNTNTLTFKLYKNVAEGNLGVNYGSKEIFSQTDETGTFTNSTSREGDTITVLIENGQIKKDFIIRDNENYYFFVLRESRRGELFLQPKQTPLERIISR